MSFDFMERIRWRQDLPTMEKFVALAIAWHADDEDGASWPAVETLALNCSCSKRTVQNAVKGLEAKGLLRRVERMNRSTIYVLVEKNLPMIERPRRAKEKSPMADVLDTGAGDSRDLFATGESPSATGESPSATGAGDSPRIDNRIDIEDSLDSGSLALPAVPTKKEELSRLIDHVASRWNEEADKHPGMQKARLPLDDSRRNAILMRSKRTEEGQTVAELWSAFFDRIAQSPFLQGRIAPGPGRSNAFKLSMTWALKSTNFNEIMEGKYGKSDRDRPTTSPDGRAMGPAEQSTRAALEARRATRERRRGG